MSDCNHESIKCMKCHRYVGIHEQTVPTNEAVKRIRELEQQVANLQRRIALHQKGNKYINPPQSNDCAIGGMNHEFA